MTHDIFYRVLIDVMRNRYTMMLIDDFNRVNDLNDLRMVKVLVNCLWWVKDLLIRTCWAKSHEAHLAYF